MIRNLLYRLATDDYRGFWAGLAKFPLFILSLFYGMVVRGISVLRRLRPVSFGCKVVSVGNITLGGTGKSALVELACAYLLKQGHKPAVLSRGYKGADEPFMLKKRLQGAKILINPDRVAAARKAVADYGADTVVLDDGFQQWHIKKDLEIVTIDSTDPFGNRNMLPRGILRQPLSSLKKADIFVLTKTNLNPDTEDIKYLLAEINPKADIFESGHIPLGFYRAGHAEEMFGLDRLKGKKAVLFSGIASCESFEGLIDRLEVKAAGHFKFPDHHRYSKEELDRIARFAKEEGAQAVITTEKDAARLEQQGLSNTGCEIFVLRIELKFKKDEERFFSRLDRLYQL